MPIGDVEVFSARAEMNRQRTPGSVRAARVLRASGDEPFDTAISRGGPLQLINIPERVVSIVGIGGPIRRIRRSASAGIPGQVLPDSVVSMGRNTQSGIAVSALGFLCSRSGRR